MGDAVWYIDSQSLIRAPGTVVPSLLLVCQQYAGKNPEIYCTELRQGTLILNCYDHPGALVVVSSLHSG